MSLYRYDVTSQVHAICFRGDGTREDYQIPARQHSYRLIVREEEAPPLILDECSIEMMTVTFEDLPDSHAGSSDGRTVIYAPNGDVRCLSFRISRREWEREIDSGLKWRPVKSIAALLTKALGAPLNAFDDLLPKTREESYYDGPIWRLLADIYGPHCVGGVQYDTLWVRPQPACPTNGDLRFLLVVRRRSDSPNYSKGYDWNDFVCDSSEESR